MKNTHKNLLKYNNINKIHKTKIQLLTLSKIQKQLLANESIQIVFPKKNNNELNFINVFFPN